MVPLGSPHARPMVRTCGEPDGIGLAAMRVKLNGSRRVPWKVVLSDIRYLVLNLSFQKGT